MRNCKGRIFALALSVMFVPAALFAGGGGQAAAPAGGAGAIADAANINPAGVFPIVKNKVTLDVFAVQSPVVSDMNDNQATKWFEEKLGIDFNVIAAPIDGYKEKRNVLLNSGNYPDIFMANEGNGFTNEEVMQYGLQGIFIPMNKLIDTYGVELKKLMAETPEFKLDMTAPDGNIYSLPVYENCYHVTFFQKMWMNKEWLAKLGLKMPETTDEFLTALRAFRDGDPNGNGQKDEIPLTGAINWNNGQPYHFLMNSFIYTNRNNYFFVDGNHTLQYAPMRAEWRDGLRFMKQLYDEKLLDSAAFTQTMPQVKQLGTNPEKVVLGAVTTGHPGHFVNISDTDSRHAAYEAVPPLKGPGGAQYATYFGGYPSGAFQITDRCKNPAAAYRFADYLFTEEGALVISEGLEGVTWRKAGEGEFDLLGRPAAHTRLTAYSHVQGTAHNFCWGNEIFRSRGSDLTGLRGKWTYSQDANSVDGYEVRLFNETKKYDGKQPQEVFTNVFLSPGVAEDAAQLKVNLEAYVNQSIVQFITGGMDIERDWDTYITQLKNLNVDKYLKYYADAYAARQALIK